MNTTTILSEILVIGILGLIWIIPIINKFTEVNFGLFFKNNLITAFVAFSAVYCVGTLLNFLSDILYNKIDNLVCSSYGGKKKIHVLRSWILIKSSDAANYMNQRRSIVRIHRSNSVNFFLIFSTHILLGSYIQNTYKYTVVYIPYISLLLFVLSFYAYLKTLNGYFSFICDTKEVIDEIDYNKQEQ